MTPTPRKNNEAPKTLSLEEIAKLVGGELLGDPDVSITGVAGIREAKKGELTFLASSKYLPFLDRTEASAVITAKDVVSKSKPLIRSSDPSLAFSKIISHFAPPPVQRIPGVHPTAVVDPDAFVGKGVFIGPCAIIEKGTSLGDGCVIEGHVFIGQDCKIGAGAHLYPNVTVRERVLIGDRVIIHSGAVIGADGFGYETIEGKHIKIPQTGSVCIEEDVEIGANVCVDRGRFHSTLIKKGAKIDNLVQIAHNVVIGENSILISQSGVSGSTTLGKNVVVAGQAGIVGHLTLGDGVIVGSQAGVSKSVPENTIILGSPAKPIAEQKKIFALIARLPELFEEWSAFKKKSGKSKAD